MDYWYGPKYEEEQRGGPVFKEGGWADCDGKPSMALSPQHMDHTLLVD